MTRAAIFFATATAVTACGKETKAPEPPDAGMMIANPYGVPVPEPLEGGPSSKPTPTPPIQMPGPPYGAAPTYTLPDGTVTYTPPEMRNRKDKKDAGPQK